jgi:hypothetical protein
MAKRRIRQPRLRRPPRTIEVKYYIQDGQDLSVVMTRLVEGLENLKINLVKLIHFIRDNIELEPHHLV